MLATDLQAFSRRAHEGLKYREVAAPTYHVESGHNFIVCDTTSTAISIFLPFAGSYPAGHVIAVKDFGNAKSNNITIHAKAPNTIDGQSTAVLKWNYAGVDLVSNGKSAWLIKA